MIDTEQRWRMRWPGPEPVVRNVVNWRNSATFRGFTLNRNGGYDRYRAALADEMAWARACRPKRCKLANNPRLRQAVASKLRLNWSPEQIAGWLRGSDQEPR